MKTDSPIYHETFGDGPDLVLLHGWSMSLDIWRDFAGQLSQQYRVTCLELPGHGRSGVLDEYTLDTISQALLAVAPVQAHWLGWSLGATVALHIACHWPDRIQRLILMAGNARFVSGPDWPCAVEPGLLQASMHKLTQAPDAALMDFMALQAFGPSTRSLLKRLRRQCASAPMPDLQALQAGLQILMQTDLRPCLNDIRQPALLLMGARDRLVPVQAGTAMQALQPGLQMAVLEQAGHVPFLSHPDETLNSVLDFLDAQRAEPEKRQASRSFSKASSSYDAVAQLQRDVAVHLLARVKPDALTGQILDLGTGTGFCGEWVLTQQAGSHLIALDIAHSMLQQARACRRQLEQQAELVCADAEALPVSERCIDTVVSSLALQWCVQLEQLFTGIRRVLKPGGRLYFSSFSAGTLEELRQAWAQADAYSHVNQFASVASIRTALQRAGLCDIVIETEQRVVYYPTVLALMRELKGLGAHNVTAGRARHLTGKRTFQTMLAAYESMKQPQGYPAHFQVIYVSAKAPNLAGA